jgi:hypothetical protein
MDDWILANAWLILAVVIILPCAGMLIGLVLRKVFKVAPKQEKEHDSKTEDVVD